MSDEMSSGRILKTRLRNGLEVRLKEIHTTPIISCWVWYRVGSRNERAGYTGISHWVEHMQFKGTPSFPGGALDRVIPRVGGTSPNAFTWLDYTAYFVTMPADQIGLAMEIEADRMVNSLFDPKEVESERTVIISEREGDENEPTFRLAEEVRAAAFRVHSYHHQIIGDKTDLERMSREDLYNHYRHYYVSGNAILAMAGDFRTSTMIKRIRNFFSELPTTPKPEFMSRPEPPQQGERRVEVEGPGETPFLEIAYRAPQGTHPDFIPLRVMDSVLSGPSSLNIFGSGISNKTSRLYRRLVEGELAASVVGGLAATIDPFLYTFRITVRPERDPEEVLAAFDEEITRLVESAVRPEEIAKAIKQARALFAYGSESITNQAFWLGYSEIFADYSWFENYLDRIAEVTADQVLEVARKYFSTSSRVIGTYRPMNMNGRSND
ncbi:MAG: insulinase family protein [Anaerolineales bacterium]|nr:insulinase family protein [Anaerolineales bacterium]